MSNDSAALIERSIVQLESLATYLANEVQRPRPATVPPYADRRLCKEVLLTISVLLPKLHAVRQARAHASERRVGGRYQRTLRGAQRHAERQRRYRAHQREVTHQGCKSFAGAPSRPPEPTGTVTDDPPF